MNILDLNETLLTTTAVAKKLGVTTETVRVWIVQRKVRAIRVGGRWKVPASSLELPEVEVADPAAERQQKLTRVVDVATARDRVEKMLG